MSMLKDISWGSIILGAAAVTALVAAAPLAAGGATILSALTAAETGLSSTAVLAGAAVTGGALGNMVSKLFHRAQDAATTLVQR